MCVKTFTIKRTDTNISSRFELTILLKRFNFLNPFRNFIGGTPTFDVIVSEAVPITLFVPYGNLRIGRGYLLFHNEEVVTIGVTAVVTIVSVTELNRYRPSVVESH
jgi:hypothetical protein